MASRIVSFLLSITIDGEGDATAQLYKVLKHDGFDSPTRDLPPCYVACRADGADRSASYRARNAVLYGFCAENDYTLRGDLDTRSLTEAVQLVDRKGNILPVAFRFPEVAS